MSLPLRVFCSNQPYLSHARCARDYASIVAELCTVVDDPDAADVALLHYEPPLLPHLLAQVPALRRLYRVGYFVWEADPLPASFHASIGGVDEIWTASWYTHALFADAHPRVHWVPHVVDYPAQADPERLQWVRAQLERAAGPPCGPTFLSISQSHNPRKNAEGLIQAFRYVAERLPGARLLLKTQGAPGAPLDRPQIAVDGAVVFIEGMLSAASLRALYDLSDVFVSAHRSEGWGLPLSDAMVARLPVVATGYSGNLDFMTPHNSFPVAADEVRIWPRDQFYLFDGSMRWGAPRRESLVAQMMAAAAACADGSIVAQIDQAAQDIQSFSRARVAVLLAAHLRRLCAQLGRMPPDP